MDTSTPSSWLTRLHTLRHGHDDGTSVCYVFESSIVASKGQATGQFTAVLHSAPHLPLDTMLLEYHTTTLLPVFLMPGSPLESPTTFCEERRQRPESSMSSIELASDMSRSPIFASACAQARRSEQSGRNSPLISVKRENV